MATNSFAKFNHGPFVCVCVFFFWQSIVWGLWLASLGTVNGQKVKKIKKSNVLKSSDKKANALQSSDKKSKQPKVKYA